MRVAALLAMLLVACTRRPDRDPSADPVALQLATSDTGCEVDGVRPATGAPAEGLWGFEDRATSHRVAAMIGPARSAAGATRVTRSVETLESRSGAGTIRHASDTASVHLEFIPPLARPAAVYAIGPFVRLASYEPCGSNRQEPLIRYLRLDADGRVATDVLLQREARP
jgi:hypothetical protein